MTEAKLRRLKCGDFVVCQRNRDDLLYQIVQEEVWGPPKLVFPAQLVENGLPGSTAYQSIQISEGNISFGNANR